MGFGKKVRKIYIRKINDIRELIKLAIEKRKKQGCSTLFGNYGN